MTEFKPLDLEYVLEHDPVEDEKLFNLVLTSLTDPSAKVRIAAITGLHYRYTPKIRKAYVLNGDIIIGTEQAPYLIGTIPFESRTNEVIPWNFDLN